MEAPEKTGRTESTGKKKSEGKTEKGLRALLEQQGEVMAELVREVRRLGRRVRALEEGVGILAYTMDTEYAEGSGESEVADETEESEEEGGEEEGVEVMAVD